ncbi:dehydrogenase with different specificitie [Geopyxis carbonaria]|nr:dehydrogenase with different specificitie [Geopyxis carbonaria]
MDVQNLFSVKNKVILVTGGAKGIGLMISTGFVAAGARVYITSRDAATCTSVAASLTASGPGTAVALPADLQSHAACVALVAELSKREPAGLHVLVNNAGANWGAPLESYPDAAFTKVLTLNLQRVFTLTQLCVPLLSTAATDADPARIVNIGSIDGLRVPALETYAYSASKAALHHLSRVLAARLGEKRITSNTLACGPFQSRMMAKTLETQGDRIREGVPLGRIGSPEDVAGACIFLSSRAGAYVNGATITVDGGSACAAKL